MGGCKSSLFGPSSQYIKVSGGEFVAVDGANIVDRLNVADLRMPYKQLLKGRMILKPGATNQLLNFLGLGDNATFLLIKVTYSPSSVIEADNYITWSFYDDMTTVNSMAQMMVLTGNSTNRIKQIYLSNPNLKYAVTLDVMVGVIDDTYEFFNDPLHPSTSFTNLNWTDIHSHVVGESIKIMDKATPSRPLIFIEINNIEMVQKSGNILILDDSSLGTIFLQFVTEFDAYQAQSLFNYIMENPNINIDIDYNGVPDTEAPIITFYEQVGQTGELIILDGATFSGPYNTSQGFTFSTSLSLLAYGNTSSSNIFAVDKQGIIDLFIDNIHDNRDGTMSMIPSNVIIKSPTASEVSYISNTGTYSVSFNFSDIAHNLLDEVAIVVVTTP